jgi:ABC-type branched-subunit amino acid transport system ATPase component
MIRAVEPVLSTESVVAGYSDLDILKGVSVQVLPGEVVAIIGPNGAGKSTLLKAIFGLVRIRSGRVMIGETEITNERPERIVARGLAYVPQLANVFVSLTVDENLDMGAFLRRDGIEAAKQKVYGLFPALNERKKVRVSRLSGGQRQMVALGRALMLEPHVLLLDEPSAGLAPNLQAQVFDQVRGIADAGTPVLVVEQNAKKALACSNRGYVLDAGRNKFEGAGSELLADEGIGRLYLGD